LPSNSLTGETAAAAANSFNDTARQAPAVRQRPVVKVQPKQADVNSSPPPLPPRADQSEDLFYEDNVGKTLLCL